MEQSNLISELMLITGWSRHRVIESIINLKKYELVTSYEKGKLILEDV